MGSFTGLARHTLTPPTAVDSSLTALKSAIMKWSTLSPVSALTVRMVQPGSRPSWPRLVLKRTFASDRTVLVLPSFCLVGHSGMLVTRSRGMDRAVAFDRSLETWKRMLVSAWPSLPLSPYPSLPLPVRLSVPMIRMLTGPSEVACLLPASPTSTVFRLLLKCW